MAVELVASVVMFVAVLVLFTVALLPEVPVGRWSCTAGYPFRGLGRDTPAK